MRTQGTPEVARSAFRIALGGAGEVKRSSRSSPDPGASGLSLAEGGPRDAAWAAGSGAMDSPALAVGGRIRPKRAAHTA